MIWILSSVTWEVEPSNGARFLEIRDHTTIAFWIDHDVSTVLWLKGADFRIRKKALLIGVSE